MRWIKYLLIILIPLMLIGCEPESLTADKLTWVSDSPILFKDDFSQTYGGWTTFEDSLSFIGYARGGFRLASTAANFQFWSVPGLNFIDTQIHVRARKLNGSDDNLFGILCRYQDANNFYALVIGSDGYYGIYKMFGGNLALIDQAHMDFSEVILREEQENDIIAICQGNQLLLIVNDTRLIQVQDVSLRYGDVGVIAGNFSEPGVDILFDDFFVIKR